jgi:hypothetical protein
VARTTTRAPAGIVIKNADYDYERSVPFRVRSCGATVHLGKRGDFDVRIEDALEQDGRVSLCLVMGASSDLIVSDLTPPELDTIMATIEKALAAARRRGIVR